MDEELAAEASQAPPPVSQDNSSDTEDEDVIEMSFKPSKSNGKGKQASTAKISMDSENAITDFENKLADRDGKIADVVDSMGDAIIQKVNSSFGSNSYTEARTMIKALRKGAIEVCHFEDDFVTALY